MDNSLKKIIDEESFKRIERHGRDILDSKEFKRSLGQVHHHKTTVGLHSIRTAMIGLWIIDRLKKSGIKVDERKVVRITLLHDLGMLGRKKRYKNDFECGYMHPRNSADTARKIWKDIDIVSIKAIKSHMWPLSLNVPTSKEAFVLCLADKLASYKDITFKGEEALKGEQIRL
ncbi:MAG: HD domain-containing protein [Butyrivibrio sp.]|nr:HD domain-containing protein [Butyrivibrio sp.]